LLNIIRVISSRRMRGAWCVECLGGKRNVCGVLAGISEGKRLLGRPRPKIKVDLKEIGWQHFMLV
jgi:hypothetical protein